MTTEDAATRASDLPRNDTQATLNVALHTGFALTLLAFITLFASSYASLIATWARSGMFQFQFLILPVCAVLVWSRRHDLARFTGAPRARGLILAAGLAVVWLVGTLLEISFARHFTAIAMLPILTFTFYGPQIARRLMFPLGYLFFAVPFGYFMVAPLQTITAHLSVWLLNLTGVPVLLSGHFIATPASTWHVAEACSGIKFFLASLAFGVLYANLFFTSLRRRLIYVACSAVVPVLANGLRVYFTILIGENFGMEHATGFDHLIFGWQFFGTVLILLFFAGWPWHQSSIRPDPHPRVPPVSGAQPSWARMMRLTLISVLVLAVAPACFMCLQAFESELAAQNVTTGTVSEWLDL